MRFPAPARVRALIVEQQSMVLSGLSSLALRIAGLASAFLLGVVLARALGPEGYGIYGLVTSLAALAMSVALLGTPQLAVREMAIRSARSDWPGARSLARSFLAATSLASFAISVLALAAAFLFAGSDARAPGLSVIGAILMAAMSVTALAASELRGLGLLFKGQFMEIVGRPAAALILIGTVLIAGFKLTSTDALWTQVVVSIVAAAVSLAWISRAMHPDRSREAPRSGWHWLKAALPLGVVDVLRQFDGTYGIILVGLLATARDLGIYRVAVASSVLVSMPVTILHIVLAPTVSRLHRFGQHAELQRLLRTASAGMCAVLVPMLIVLLLFGRPLVQLVFGPVYGDAWLPLVLLCAAQLVFGFFGMGPILLAMADSERHLTIIYLVAVGAGVVAAAFLIPLYGAVGAAAAQILSMGTVAALSGRFARRRLGLGTTFLAHRTKRAPLGQE
jgi:O-antigen/teichoic acid export membrane protein